MLIMTLALAFISLCITALYCFADAAGIFYEKIKESGSSTNNGDLIQETLVINKSFHQCSMKDTCNYVTKEISNGIVTTYNSEDELPLNKTGLRIWKKIYHGASITKYLLLKMGAKLQIIRYNVQQQIDVVL